PRDHPRHLGPSPGSVSPRRRSSGPARGRRRAPRSAQLRLLVEDVLADDRIVLLELELVRRVLPVLHGSVEVPGTGTRLELDDLALALLGHRGLLALPALTRRPARGRARPWSRTHGRVGRRAPRRARGSAGRARRRA